MTLFTRYWITRDPNKKSTYPRSHMTLFTHYFTCEDCGITFTIMTTNEHYSNVLGTIDCMVTCPNSLCMSANVVMDDVTEDD